MKEKKACDIAIALYVLSVVCILYYLTTVDELAVFVGSHPTTFADAESIAAFRIIDKFLYWNTIGAGIPAILCFKKKMAKDESSFIIVHALIGIIIELFYIWKYDPVLCHIENNGVVQTVGSLKPFFTILLIMYLIIVVMCVMTKLQDTRGE